MLVRLGFAKQDRVTTVPTVAVLVALLGATGLLVGGAAAVMILVRGTAFQPSEVAPLIGMFGFFGFMSVMMSVAGSLAVRAGRLSVWREQDVLRWRMDGAEHSMPTDRAEIVVQQHGVGKYQQFTVALVGGSEPLELGASMLESVAKAQSRRYAKSLGLES